MFGLLFLGLIIILIVFGGVWLIYQSTNQPGQNNGSAFISLKDNWAALETKAHQWKNDAYFFNVEYETLTDAQLTAKYLAPSVPDYELILTIDKKGGLNANPLHLGFNAAVSKPIGLQDFSIDSQAAMALFAQDKSISGCLTSSYPKKQLSIESDLMGFPSWTLMVENCPSAGKYSTSYLNAQSGKLIDPATIK